MYPSYAEIVEAIREASTPVHELHGDGHVAVIPDGGRIAAIAFRRDEPSVLWSNPGLARPAGQPRGALADGVGGDRLWFGPETRFIWRGVPDWVTLTNHEVPPAMDPGSYVVTASSSGHVVLETRLELQPHDAQTPFRGTLTRAIALTPAPVARAGMSYVGVNVTNTLRLGQAPAGLALDYWRLLQVRAGSVLVVPLARPLESADEPLVYCGRSNRWHREPGQLIWAFTGAEDTKQGLPAGVLTGRCGVLNAGTDGQFTLIVRQCPVNAGATYVDAPYGVSRSDQAFQLWDGHGFGEVEHHSPGIVAGETRVEADQVWAFWGERAGIVATANDLLGVDVSVACAIADRWGAA